MTASEEGKGVSFEIKYATGRPVELADLGESFRALGRQYEDYVTRHGYDHQPGNAKLYVAEVHSGSIIVLLKNLLEQGSMVLKDIDVLAGFITNMYELIDYFRTQSRSLQKISLAMTPPGSLALSNLSPRTAKVPSALRSWAVPLPFP